MLPHAATGAAAVFAKIEVVIPSGRDAELIYGVIPYRWISGAKFR